MVPGTSAAAGVHEVDAAGEVRRAFPTMGTLAQLCCRAAEPDRAERAIAAASAAVQSVAQLMSAHDADSDLGAVNAFAHRQVVRVHPWTWMVLRRSVRLAELSGGLFDVTVAPWLASAGLLPFDRDIAARTGRSSDLRFHADFGVSSATPVALDLGGIAKGFAVDRAIRVLRQHGCDEALVNIGGDLRCYGATRRAVHLRTEGGLVEVASLRRGAVASSAPYAPRDEDAGEAIGCIVDRSRGLAWSGPGPVMVGAPTCMIADALTKVAALAGPSCRPLLARFGAQGCWPVVPLSGRDRSTGHAQVGSIASCRQVARGGNVQ